MKKVLIQINEHISKNSRKMILYNHNKSILFNVNKKSYRNQDFNQFLFLFNNSYSYNYSRNNFKLI